LNEGLRRVLFRQASIGATRVVVTGPQRSGTRIAARILAEELGFAWLPEEVVGVDDVRALKRLLAVQDRFVIQAPGLSHMCHRLPEIVRGECGWSSTVLVVWMDRPPAEIRASERRVGWTRRGHHKAELRKYQRTPEVAGFASKWRHICEVKRAAWDGVQKVLLRSDGIVLRYRDLETHRLFVPRSGRGAFRWNQTEE